MRSIRDLRRLTIAAVAAVTVLTGSVASPASAALGVPRVYLKVLVITDGTPWVDAIRKQLESEGAATTVIDLNDPGRQVITKSFLSNIPPLIGTPTGFFQGVVLPSNFVPGLSTAEMNALANYESQFRIRQVEGYVFPNGDIGMNPPTYSGTLDAATVTVSGAARSGAFRYLSGSFRFEGSPGGTESYGYLAQPLPDTATTSYTPYLTATVPGTGQTGVLAGVYKVNERERLAINFAYHYFQEQFRHLSHGIVDWVTKGIHLGLWRNYFAVHVDDVFNDNETWSTTGNCTPPSASCAPGTPETPRVRMTAADVQHASQWQRSNNFKLDLLFNGGAEAQFQEDGPDPTFDAFQAAAGDFRWANHTYTHEFLGCAQDVSVSPWRCQTDAAGNTVWVSRATVDEQILANIDWANDNGFPIDRAELVSGEHSGLRSLPQQTVDNPRFVNALGPAGVQYVGLDASREPVARPIGAALGVPRHPINIFYNASTKAEEIDEYNWVYTSRANGGSGLCEDNPASTCIAPLDPVTGWDTYVLPLQVRIANSFLLRNDPRVFYVHQSNLTGDRIAYPWIEGMLSAYRNTYSANAPLVNATFRATSDALNQQQTWAQTLAAGSVTGYVQANTITLLGPSGTRVPITAPDSTLLGGILFGNDYGGEHSGYVTLGLLPSALVLLATPYGALMLPNPLLPLTAIAPNIIDAPHVAIDPALGMITGPLGL